MKKILTRKTNFGVSVLFFICISFIAQACEKEDPVQSDTTRRILFIGNSLTYTNNLPATVVKLAAEKGIEISAETLAFPNYALEDHWNDGAMQGLIRSKKFEFVVVQQGPSSQEDGRIMLQEYGARIKAVCEEGNAKLAFFVVWPAHVNLHSFGNVIKNYTDAAIATSSIVCPVGQAWQKHFSDTNDFSYYGTDMFHPSQTGSAVAAAVIVEALYK